MCPKAQNWGGRVNRDLCNRFACMAVSYRLIRTDTYFSLIYIYNYIYKYVHMYILLPCHSILMKLFSFAWFESDLTWKNLGEATFLEMNSSRQQCGMPLMYFFPCQTTPFFPWKPGLRKRASKEISITTSVLATRQLILQNCRDGRRNGCLYTIYTPCLYSCFKSGHAKYIFIHIYNTYIYVLFVGKPSKWTGIYNWNLLAILPIITPAKVIVMFFLSHNSCL